VTRPHIPHTPSGETNSPRTESTDHRIPTNDDEPGTSDIAEQCTADDRPSTADSTDDHTVVDDATATATATDIEEFDSKSAPRHTQRRHVLTYVVLPLVVMGMAVGAGYLKYQDGSVSDAQTAAMSSVQAATEGTIALLSYNPDTVQTTLTAARDRLTGPFRDSYTSLTNDVVIPGAQEKKISATATVPAASSVAANENHAVVLVFVDQSVIVGNDAASATASAVQVTLDMTGDRWLISGFDPK
jgi:Mce-associated membrane protein